MSQRDDEFLEFMRNRASPLHQSVRLIENESWLPRTPALLNMVNHVHIPTGFRQAAPPQ